ncbi:MAG: TolC family protein [Flavobacteriia bacterium]|nr:TolC family protein [Flavobacteriia bacterium]
MFKNRVLTYHPIVKQAKNKVEIGENELMKAKGNLDPKFETELSNKEFQGKEYYRLSNSGLKFPTWLGIDFKAGYENNNGVFINNEHSTPSSGLWYAGVEFPLGEGLLFDERRVAIQTAKVIEKMAINEKELILNDLLLDAFSSYWTWYESYQKLKITEEGLEFAKIRFNGVRENALLGEVPFIDTVEAKIQLDSRKFEKTQAEFEYQNATSILNLYLWTENNLPLELEDSTIPIKTIQKVYIKDNLKLRFNVENKNDLPLILNSLYKLDQLKIEEKWKREQLKPELNIAYNPISQPVGNNPIQNFSPQNYKFGLTASMPLFLRKERGALSQTKLKVENAKLDISLKMNEIQQKEIQIRNDLFRFYEQVEIQQTQVIQAKLLRDSEQTRFDSGESSLFLVNSREMTYLQYKIKLVELESKMKITEAKWLWIYSALD